MEYAQRIHSTNNCKEIEYHRQGNTGNVQTNRSTKTYNKTGCLKSTKGDITGKEEITKMWTEYIKDRCHDERQDASPVSNNLGLLIQASEVMQATHRIRQHNWARPDNITK